MTNPQRVFGTALTAELESRSYIRQTPASVALLRGRRQNTPKGQKTENRKFLAILGFLRHLFHKRFYGGERKSLMWERP
jgi:hypothetical protein